MASDGASRILHPRAFWTANTIELFERCAFYGMYIVITLYLTDRVGFTDVQTGWIAGIFASLLYLLPTFSGAVADKIGFRAGLAIAFSLLTVGYGLMGLWPTKGTAIVALALIMLGGSFVKPIISGTVAKCSDDDGRARAFAIFYVVVNVGGFIGKTVAYPLRINLGVEYICLYSAAMAAVALLLVGLLYRNPDTQGAGKSLSEVAAGLWTVVRNRRFMTLIVIVAGFWIIQAQLYSSIPKYTTRVISPTAAPEWMANVNPGTIVLFQLLITRLSRRLRAVTSIGVGLAIIPWAAVVIALHPRGGESWTMSLPLLGMFELHTATVVMCLGIMLIAFGEMFLSPRFLEFASKQAPPGEVGLYMGYSHLTTFFAKIVAFVLSGYLLNAFCPDPKTLTPEQALHAYDHAHYLWYVFAAIGVLAMVALLIFKVVTDRADRRGGAA